MSTPSPGSTEAKVREVLENMGINPRYLIDAGQMNWQIGNIHYKGSVKKSESGEIVDFELSAEQITSYRGILKDLRKDEEEVETWRY